MYPLHYYVILAAITFIGFVGKDSLVLSLYTDHRPKKPNTPNAFYIGYMATHWVATFSLFWLLELIWRSYTHVEDSYYGFVLANTEAAIRFGSFVFSKRKHSNVSNAAINIGRLNYLIVSVAIPLFLLMLGYFSG